MKHTMRFITMSIIVIILWSLTGCVDQSTAPVATNTLTPTGTISGKIYDRCTNMAINGATISVGYNGTVSSTTSDASGSFSFANVPAGNYTVLNGQSVATGTYLITASLVNYNKQQTDSSKRYQNYYYFTNTITFTSTIDSQAVTGLVGAVVCSIATLSAIVEGTVVDQNNQAVANASVTIFNSSTNCAIAPAATTASDGSFKFTNIENGLSVYFIARSADGSLQVKTGTMTTPCNVPLDSLRSQVATERIQIAPVDNVAPFVTLISPANNSDVSAAGLQIVYTFSEPIKQTAYTQTDLGLGYGTIVDDITIIYNGLKKTQTALPIPAFAWNADFTQLTVTPSGLVGSAKYTVVDTAAMRKLTDLAGNAMVNNTKIVGDFELLNFTTEGGSAVPAAPTLARQLMPTQYVALDYNGGNVLLEWNYDATARGYNIYSSVNGGSFDLLTSNVQSNQYKAATGDLIVGSLPNPLGPGTVSYMITGVSKDLVEGPASNVITVSDQVKPQLIYYPAPAAAPGTNNWVYTLGFSEPMAQAAVELASNYTFSNTGGVTYTINKVVYGGSDGTRYVAYLYITSSVAPVAGYVVTTSSAITDLAGNGMDAAFNSNTY